MTRKTEVLNARDRRITDPAEMRAEAKSSRETAAHSAYRSARAFWIRRAKALEARADELEA